MKLRRDYLKNAMYEE